ncbi:hypothetical protein [Arthrobacter sp. MYb213]|uniref:hypothetical protein n=1 Tax=Arthrobacter sp. MYb213 TaxID=1848595 RepID=UPI000CFCBDB9|nr:hypothetical protein [Arthrobacter sp. MYb213]PRB67481.1 hypothetical protein CQ011_15415 [Arthrobacter sp. MYb213]
MSDAPKQATGSFTLPIFGVAIVLGALFGAALSTVIFWPVLTHGSSGMSGNAIGGLLLAAINGAWLGAVIAVFPATGAVIGLAIGEKKSASADASQQANIGATGALVGGLLVVLGVSVVLYMSLGPAVFLVAAVIFLGLCFATAWTTIGSLEQRREATRSA